MWASASQNCVVGETTSHSTKRDESCAKSLVIRRRPESSGFIQHAFVVCPCHARDMQIDWIPACAGMTGYFEYREVIHVRPYKSCPE
jgi:hypothetical protein